MLGFTGTWFFLVLSCVAFVFFWVLFFSHMTRLLNNHFLRLVCLHLVETAHNKWNLLKKGNHFFHASLFIYFWWFSFIIIFYWCLVVVPFLCYCYHYHDLAAIWWWYAGCICFVVVFVISLIGLPKTWLYVTCEYLTLLFIHYKPCHCLVIFIIFIFVIVLAGNSEPCPAVPAAPMGKVRRPAICTRPHNALLSSELTLFLFS